MKPSVNADRIVSISAIIVAVGTLFIIIYQTNLARDAQQASVLPYIQIAFSQSDAGAFISVGNRGVGPALIDDIRVHYRGEEFVGDPYEFYSSGDSGIDLGSNIYIDRILPGMLIPAGDVSQTIGVYGPEDRQRLAQLFSLVGIEEREDAELKAVIEVTYSSVYGTRWKIRSDELVPRPQ
jgi:hypothetical protein